MSENKIIRGMQDLYDFFESRPSFAALNREIYDYSACGGSISVHGKVGGKPVAFHNGYQGPLPEGFKITSFTIQSIVEGSDAEVNSGPFKVGVATADDITDWIDEMEYETARLWREAHPDWNKPHDAECESCEGVGYLETTEDKIVRCDACKKFLNDEVAQKAAARARPIRIALNEAERQRIVTALVSRYQFLRQLSEVEVQRMMEMRDLEGVGSTCFPGLRNTLDAEADALEELAVRLGTKNL